MRDVLVCGSWNVKGLSDLKFCEIIRHMQEFDLDILCLQETRAEDKWAIREFPRMGCTKVHPRTAAANINVKSNLLVL